MQVLTTARIPCTIQAFVRRQRSLAAFRLAVFEKYREYARQPGTRLFMTTRMSTDEH